MRKKARIKTSNIEKIRENFVENIKPWHISLLFFIIYSILIIKTPQILSGDEIFYYDQALHLRKGEFVNFENTQPLFFPAVMAAAITENVIILRLFNAFFSILAIYFLFKIVEERFSKKTAILSALIIGSSKFYTQYATTLHTEALLVLMIILSLKYFLEYLKNQSYKNAILFGIFAGLSLQTKVMGISVPVFFTLYLLYKNPREIFKLKYILAMFIALLILIPYFFVGGSKFLIEKTTASRSSSADLNESFFALQQLVPHFTISFLILLLFALFFYKSKEENKLFYFFPIAFFIMMLIPRTILFTRQFYPMIPFLAVIAADYVITESRKSIKYVAIFLVLLFFVSNLRILPGLPKLYHQAYYVDIPEGCQEIKNLKHEGQDIELPFFTQPTGQQWGYYAVFNAADNYNYVILEYLDDDPKEFRIDQISYMNRYEFYPYSRHVVKANISKGEHLLDISIWNGLNIGGIGQILLCKESNLHKGEVFLFPPEEII